MPLINTDLEEIVQIRGGFIILAQIVWISERDVAGE